MKIKILTWNISYGYGIGSEGTADYQSRSKEFYESSLSKICHAIKAIDPDLVFLQEVDFDSSRSHHINQLEFIARTTGLIHREGIISWDAPYVPYPGLSPFRHFRKVVSGGAILSRYPISKVQTDLLPKPKENSNLYNYFYLNRYFQIVQLHLPESSQSLCIANLHLEAFSVENRELHLVKLQDRLRDFRIELAGGDFNGTIPLSQDTLAKNWLPLQPKEATFPSSHPSELLDGFIINSAKLKRVSMTVLNTGTVSDHLPILLELECPVDLAPS